MIIRKTFQYSLCPPKKQARELDNQLEECRWLYNEWLSQTKLVYEDLEIFLNIYQQTMLIPLLNEERPSLNNIYFQVLQNIVDRLDKGFQAFFRRFRNGEKLKFLRFRGMHRYNSFCFPQTGFALDRNKLKTSKIGTVRVKMHNCLGEILKTCTIKKIASGHWSVSLSCEITVEPEVVLENFVGIDRGLENFATISDGNIIGNPRFFGKEERTLAKGEHKLSKLQRGTKERHKQGKVVSRMIEQSQLAKSITDTSWNLFFQSLTYKAEAACRKVCLVNPAYTTHNFHRCGYKSTRDFNGAQNILAAGLNSQREISKSLCLKAKAQSHYLTTSHIHNRLLETN
jgi:putative transposase